MSTARTEHEWLALCQIERDHRTWLSEHGSERTSAEFRAKLRDWWASIEHLIDFQVKEIAELEGARRNMPLDVLIALRGFAGHLAIGQIPKPISDAATEGRHPPGPSERLHIGYSVAYYRAATGGIEHCGDRIEIADKTPVKTVMREFGVSRSTVQGWNARQPAAFLGVNRINGEILTSLMQDAGKIYRKYGRASDAILLRSAKRKTTAPRD